MLNEEESFQLRANFVQAVRPAEIVVLVIQDLPS